MGNSASSAVPNPSKEPKDNREKDSSPHKSLRTKKKSLELPDLASLSISSSSPYYYGRGRHPTPPKSACIPIPQSNNPNAQIHVEPRERPQNNISATDVLVTEPSTHLPFPPPSRGVGDAALAAAAAANSGAHNPYFRAGMNSRGYHSTSNQRYQQYKAAQERIQELYNQSNQVPAPPPSAFDSHPHYPSSSRKSDFLPEVVQSSIPIGLVKGLPKDGDASPIMSNDDNEPIPVKITWRGGGKSVVLARAGDNDWKGRQSMERESPTSRVYSTTVALPRGTHHFRFLVDDQWRVADDLPTAVDDQGTLANYVAVLLSYSPPASSTPAVPSQTQRYVPGQSFWSAASSADGDMPEPPSSSLQHRQSSRTNQSVVWTNEIPLELIEAAREEEVYLQASAGQYEANGSRGGGTTYVSGFVPAPNIPPAPGLPRHLDKLILNTRMSPSPGSSNAGKGSSSGKGKGRDRDREKGDRDRRHREGKERDRRLPPPPPPPSEDGSGTGLLDPAPPEPLNNMSQTTVGAGSGTSTGDVTPTPTTPDPSAGGVVPSTTSISLDTPARSRPIGIDPSNTPVLADDGSVLPVPSHVVLHHLCTSAIRNGVLAVGNTTRYREKYLTTIYYKPT
ncbi:hypothetical protein AX17_006193 [Amanita inopinata Kibby_2008]|nr:hypothetical protein AX17_006193 [Amanita inopinata Kibby_2008]